MTTLQIIQYLERLPGVHGIIMSNSEGGIIESAMPEIFDEEMIAGLAADGSNAFETLRSEDPDIHELRVDFDLMTIMMKKLDGALLFIVIDQESGIPSIRIAANVAAKRYSPAAVNDSPTEVNTPLSTQPVLEKSTQPVKTKEKKKNGGSIWG